MPSKVSEIIRLIEADGWVLVTTRGSHRQYKHPTKPGRVTVAGKPSDTLHPAHCRASSCKHRSSEAVMSQYLVIIERDEVGGYSAWAPDLPGVVAAAATYDECLELMREAVELHLEGLREDGLPIPVPNAVGAETVTTAALLEPVSFLSAVGGSHW